MPTSSDPIALSIGRVSKTYRIFSRRDVPTSFGEAVARRVRRPFRRPAREDFEALTDVSFDVRRAERVGLIGRNGAGKSTLLKILSRITAPTSGRIEVYGRLGSLLEVGTGFNPELTGRENIFLNGSILGMRRAEVIRAFESIVEFSEIDAFLDTPVKRYSSGMYVRLAFSVAAHLNPEILLVDEVLAVGDARFQEKCLGKMDDVSNQEGRTIVFVSHNMPMIQALCPRTVFLDQGRVAFDGETPDAVEQYLSAGFAGSEREPGIFDLTAVPRPSVQNPILRRVELRRTSGTLTDRFPMGDDICMGIDVEGFDAVRDFMIMRIHTDTGVPVATISTKQRGIEIVDPDAPVDHVSVRISELRLVPGKYSVDLSAQTRGRGGATVLDRVEHAVKFEVVASDVYGTGFQVAGGTFRAGIVYAESTWEVHSGGLITGITRTHGHSMPRA